MKQKLDPTVLTLWVNRLIALVLGVLLFTLPALLDWYCTKRELMDLERTALTVAFYCCAGVIFVALWQIEKLMGNILSRQVFIRENVHRVRVIQHCCGLVGLICIPAALCYYPLVFLVCIMGFLCLVVSVVAQVTDAAVSLREENDLTI